MKPIRLFFVLFLCFLTHMTFSVADNVKTGRQVHFYPNDTAGVRTIDKLNRLADDIYAVLRLQKSARDSHFVQHGTWNVGQRNPTPGRDTVYLATKYADTLYSAFFAVQWFSGSSGSVQARCHVLTDSSFEVYAQSVSDTIFFQWFTIGRVQ